MRREGRGELSEMGCIYFCEFYWSRRAVGSSKFFSLNNL